MNLPKVKMLQVSKCLIEMCIRDRDRETTTKFLEACEQFERIMNDSGFVRLRRLSTDEIVGTDGKACLLYTSCITK